MNREQKAVAIAEIATQIDEAGAVFAVDYRGISVPQVAELRARLRDADATFRVVKNSLTERAADQSGAQTLKEFLTGPTALTFVRGDAATAAKAIADYGRVTHLLPFKGGLMDGAVLDAEQIRALSRLPSREILYGQLVGIVASPIGGLVRTLNALLGGLAVALGQVREKKESGEIPAGAPPPARAGDSGDAAAEARASEDAPAGDSGSAAAAAAAAPAGDDHTPSGQAQASERAEPADEDSAPATTDGAPAGAQAAPADEQPAAATDAGGGEAPATGGAEPQAESAQDDDKQADDPAEEQSQAAEENTKED